MLLTLVVGCRSGSSSGPAVSGDVNQDPTRFVAEESEADQSPAATAEKEDVPDPLRGTVKEAMHGGAYVYILVASDAGEHWAAARAFPVAVGDEVELAGLAAMPQFTSPTLKRTFDVIQFVGSAKVIGGDGTQSLSSELPAGHPSVDDVVLPPLPAASSIDRSADIDADSIEVTVAQLFARKAELSGKLVKIRGKVAKANRGILGSNWLHIRDGTGEPPENDITVTSKTDFAAKGSNVIIVGTVTLDKDFGAGYRYDVIVENAAVRVVDE